MKKLMLTTLAILMAVFPFVVLAGDIYLDAKATFHNDAKFTDPGLQTARGTATITYNETDKWTVTLRFSGLLKNYNYVFQFGVQDQLLNRYDYPVTTDARGRINMTFPIADLDTEIDNDTHYLPEEHNPWPDYKGYTILRLLDLEGESGGKLLTPGLEPNEEEPDYNPYCLCLDPNSPDCEYPNATMVMRARQDDMYGLLEFLKPRGKKK